MILFLKLEEKNQNTKHTLNLSYPIIYMSQKSETVQCKNTLSTFQPKCIQNKMTASFRNLILKTEMHHSSENISSHSCGSWSSSPCMFLSQPSYTALSAVPILQCDEPHQKTDLNLEKIQHPLSSERTSQTRTSTFLLLNSFYSGQHHIVPSPVTQQNLGGQHWGRNKQQGVLETEWITEETYLKSWL